MGSWRPAALEGAVDFGMDLRFDSPLRTALGTAISRQRGQRVVSAEQGPSGISGPSELFVGIPGRKQAISRASQVSPPSDPPTTRSEDLVSAPERRYNASDDLGDNRV